MDRLFQMENHLFFYQIQKSWKTAGCLALLAPACRHNLKDKTLFFFQGRRKTRPRIYLVVGVAGCRVF